MDKLMYTCVCLCCDHSIYEKKILSVEELIGPFTIIGGEIENGYVLLGKREQNSIKNKWIDESIFENFEKENDICDDVVLIKTDRYGDPIDLFIAELELQC